MNLITSPNKNLYFVTLISLMQLRNYLLLLQGIGFEEAHLSSNQCVRALWPRGVPLGNPEETDPLT